MPEGAEVVVRGVAWRNVWQLPLLLLSIGLIVAGFWHRREAAVAPDAARLLATANQHLLDGRYPEAGLLHEEVAALIGPGDDQLRSELMVARADLEARRPPSDRDDSLILEQYDGALALGRELGVEQRIRRAGALAGLGRHEEAFQELLGPVGGDVLERIRHRIMTGLVRDAEGGDPERVEILAPALDRYAAVPGRSLEHATWAALTSARMRLSVGEAETGIEVLQRAMRRLDRAGESELGDWKGRAYSVYGRLWLESGDREAARPPLEIALIELPIGDEDRLRAAAALAWIDHADGRQESAIVRFGEILDGTPHPATGRQVRLWRAEAHAALGQHEAAVEDYRHLLGQELERDGLHLRRLQQSLEDRIREAMLLDQPERAVTYAEMGLQSGAFGFDEELMNAAAAGHRILGERILRAHSDEPDLMSIPVDVVPEEARREASAQFRRAGDLYDQLAASLRGDTTRRVAWITAQRSAGECYDLGAHGANTIRAYRDYLAATTAEDLERAHVAFRYARVLHAAGRLQEALEAYDDLVETHESMPEASNKARVDAARCLIALGRNQEARARLEAIVRGLPKGPYPDSIGFREAKFALGRLLIDLEDWTDAISTLNEVLRRYPEDPRIEGAAFNLALAHQEAAAALAVELADLGLTPSRRGFVRNLRSEHLEGAATAYGRVVEVFGTREPDELGALERDQLRDAAIGQADSMFELGRFEEAVELYERIERRYRKEATSLGALIRLVQIWDELGDAQMAEKAHRQAELRLAQLPESAFDFPASRFDRESWRIWIERRPLRGLRVGVGE